MSPHNLGETMNYQEQIKKLKRRANYFKNRRIIKRTTKSGHFTSKFMDIIMEYGRISHDVMSDDYQIAYNELQVRRAKHQIKELELKVECGLMRAGAGDDCGDSWTNFWVFDGAMSDEEIDTSLSKLEIKCNTDRGVFDDNDWDCSGMAMSYIPSITKRTASRVLVTQNVCIDC